MLSVILLGIHFHRVGHERVERCNVMYIHNQGNYSSETRGLTFCFLFHVFQEVQICEWGWLWLSDEPIPLRFGVNKHLDSINCQCCRKCPCVCSYNSLTHPTSPHSHRLHRSGRCPGCSGHMHTGTPPHYRWLPSHLRLHTHKHMRTHTHTHS